MLRRTAVVAALLLAAAVAVLRLWPAPPLRHAAPLSQAVFSSDASLLRIGLASDEQYRVWTPIDEIDPRLVEAVLLYEDRWYRWHPGVNPASLARGAWSTYSGQTRRGASTITMQLVRRLYRLDTGSPWGKLRQVAAALWLEARHGKREILEAYLNLAPYGGNVEGVGAASLVYFGKRASQLSLPEALALAVIPQNPNRRGASQAAWPQALHAARERLWTHWQATHGGTLARDAEMDLPLTLRSVKQLPFKAPHAVQAAMARRGEILPRTTLTLHGPTQAAVERALRQFVERRQAVGVRNAAALLVDTTTMEVRAWVGSADYFDETIDGQVNATSAKRSPGSTLKPFIYALALDQGVLHPRTVLKDAPTAFGTYTPENFDGRFEGPITAQDALVKSRNIPAVAVSAQLREPTLHEFLKQAGVRRMASERHYGLALTLGGGEVSMEELAVLYAMLANGGTLAPLRTEQGEPPAATRRLLSEEASFITLDMLTRNPRPDTGLPAFPAVAWKTGTSWGFRDAWTAGIFGRFALVVWVGNFDGSSNPAFVGVQTAAPLFFHIVDSLRSQGLDPGAMARSTPAGVSRVQVCAASGDLPNADCPELAATWFIAGKSPIRQSTLHRAVWIDTASGREVCAPGPGVRREVFEYWGSDMLQLFALAGLPRRVPPAPRCRGAAAEVAAGAGPQISSPLRAASYVQRIGRPQALTLRATSSRPGRLYWFADQAFLGQAATGQELAWQPPAAGSYLLRVVDDRGASDSRELNIEFMP